MVPPESGVWNITQKVAEVSGVAVDEIERILRQCYGGESMLEPHSRRS